MHAALDNVVSRLWFLSDVGRAGVFDHVVSERNNLKH